MHLNPLFFVDHLVFFFITLGPLGPNLILPLGPFCLAMFFFFLLLLGPLGPNIMFLLLCYMFFYIFLTFLFFLILLQMLKQLPAGRMAFNCVGSFGSLSLILELITLLSIIVNHFVNLRRGVCLALGNFLFSQLLQLQFSLYLHYLLESSLGSSTIQNVFYAINWAHKLAGFDNRNPCDVRFYCKVYC